MNNFIWSVARSTVIGTIHFGLLALPVGVQPKASVLTIQVGMSQTFLSNNRVQAYGTNGDTDTPKGWDLLYRYQKDDWFNHPVWASDGTPLADFQLIYDSGSQGTVIPEAPIWLMLSLFAGGYWLASFANAVRKDYATNSWDIASRD